MKTISIITHFTAWDRRFLFKNNFISTTDKHGRDRNKGQLEAIRKVDNKVNFDLALIAISYEVVTQCHKLNIGVIPTFHINKFVMASPKDAMMVNFVIQSVMKRFKEGEKLSLHLSQEVKLSQSTLLNNLLATKVATIAQQAKDN